MLSLSAIHDVIIMFKSSWRRPFRGYSIITPTLAADHYSKTGFNNTFGPFEYQYCLVFRWLLYFLNHTLRQCAFPITLVSFHCFGFLQPTKVIRISYLLSKSFCKLFEKIPTEFIDVCRWNSNSCCLSWHVEKIFAL